MDVDLEGTERIEMNGTVPYYRVPYGIDERDGHLPDDEVRETGVGDRRSIEFRFPYHLASIQL